MDFCDRVAEIEGYMIVIQALFNIACKAIWNRLNLEDCLYMGTFQSQPSGYNQADIAGRCV